MKISIEVIIGWRGDNKNHIISNMLEHEEKTRVIFIRKLNDNRRRNKINYINKAIWT